MNHSIVKFQTGFSMHELVIATYSLFISFNNEMMSFISFIIDPRDFGFEYHSWEIIWLAYISGIRFDF